MHPKRASDPVVIVGGFASWPRQYLSMRDTIRHLTEQPVTVVPMHLSDWFTIFGIRAWSRMLDKTADCVERALSVSATGTVTLVGHSAGGLAARVFIRGDSFCGRRFSTGAYVSRVITLGTPHHGRDVFPPHKWLAERERNVETNGTDIISVAGESVMGGMGLKPSACWAYVAYRFLHGRGSVYGDGLVPTAAALLRGSHQVVLRGVSHARLYGRQWYGTPSVVQQWWNRCADAGYPDR